MEKKKTRVSKIISYALGALILTSFIVTMILELALPDTSKFVIWAKENVWDITALPDILNSHYKVFIHCAILIVVVVIVSKVIRKVFRNVMHRSNRAKTSFANAFANSGSSAK